MSEPQQHVDDDRRREVKVTDGSRHAPPDGSRHAPPDDHHAPPDDHHAPFGRSWDGHDFDYTSRMSAHERPRYGVQPPAGFRVHAEPGRDEVTDLTQRLAATERELAWFKTENARLNERLRLVATSSFLAGQNSVLGPVAAQCVFSPGPGSRKAPRGLPIGSSYGDSGEQAVASTLYELMHNGPPLSERGGQEF